MFDPLEKLMESPTNTCLLDPIGAHVITAYQLDHVGPDQGRKRGRPVRSQPEAKLFLDGC